MHMQLSWKQDLKPRTFDVDSTSLQQIPKQMCKSGSTEMHVNNGDYPGVDSHGGQDEALPIDCKS